MSNCYSNADTVECGYMFFVDHLLLNRSISTTNIFPCPFLICLSRRKSWQSYLNHLKYEHQFTGLFIIIQKKIYFVCFCIIRIVLKTWISPLKFKLFYFNSKNQLLNLLLICFEISAFILQKHLTHVLIFKPTLVLLNFMWTDF